MPGSKSNGAKKSRQQYEHKNEQRANDSPVGLVTPQTDRDAGIAH